MRNGAWTLAMVGLAAAAALFLIDGMADFETQTGLQTVPSRAQVKLAIGAGLGLGALLASRRRVK